MATTSTKKNFTEENSVYLKSPSYFSDYCSDCEYSDRFRYSQEERKIYKGNYEAISHDTSVFIMDDRAPINIKRSHSIKQLLNIILRLIRPNLKVWFSLLQNYVERLRKR